MIREKISEKISLIDCNHIFPMYAAAYLLIEGKRCVFVETNTQFAVPRFISELKEYGLGPENVEYIIVTHVHLDHAGGTSALVNLCPNAVVLAQQRAARHIIDPTRLIDAVKALFGEEEFIRIYGEIGPVEEERVRVVRDGEIIEFGNRELKFIYTLGHAKHHMCIYDSGTNGIFTGDSFGLAFPILQSGNRPFIFPSTSPTDFDPNEACDSINKIYNTGARTAFLTHYGPFEHVKEGSEMMIESIHKMENILNDALNSDMDQVSLERFCMERMIDFFKDEMESRDLPFSYENQKFLQTDIELNAQGIAFAVQRLRGINS
ncbi:MAG: MBL fold metallo-hydrolase [Spirochaetota bacterium]|nr:MBL fold metallo-hydrolase [Spirochaetota bacterium]